MNYETATDLELNRKLHEILGNQLPEIDGVWVVEDKHRTVKTDPNGGLNRRALHPDYCADWNATMPLVVEYGISVKSPSLCGSVDDWTVTYWKSNDDGYSHFTWRDKSPLRAIVICLIKVLGQNK